MLKKNNIKVKKIEGDYIAECSVIDTDAHELFYVVADYDKYTFTTYKSSYLDYALGKSSDKPEILEEGINPWIDKDSDSKFLDFYEEASQAITLEQHRFYVNHKYPHLKKPKGNIHYQILNKREEGVYGCGPMGSLYEIEFLILPSNKHLFVSSDDSFGMYTLTDYSVIDIMAKEDNNENIDYNDPIEDWEDFSLTKNSFYYDLFLELEKFIDNYEQ